MILSNHLTHCIQVLVRHRDACIMLARVERKIGKPERVQQLVKRARGVNRDVVSLARAAANLQVCL